MQLTINNIKNFKVAMQVVNKVIEKKSHMPVLLTSRLSRKAKGHP